VAGVVASRLSDFRAAQRIPARRRPEAGSRFVPTPITSPCGDERLSTETLGSRPRPERANRSADDVSALYMRFHALDGESRDGSPDPDRHRDVAKPRNGRLDERRDRRDAAPFGPTHDPQTLRAVRVHARDERRNDRSTERGGARGEQAGAVRPGAEQVAAVRDEASIRLDGSRTELHEHAALGEPRERPAETREPIEGPRVVDEDEVLAERRHGAEERAAGGDERDVVTAERGKHRKRVVGPRMIRHDEERTVSPDRAVHLEAHAEGRQRCLRGKREPDAINERIEARQRATQTAARSSRGPLDEASQEMRKPCRADGGDDLRGGERGERGRDVRFFALLHPAQPSRRLCVNAKLSSVFFVFIANLARPALVEADALAQLLAKTPYEARLALAAGPPSVVLTTADRDRAADVVGVLRSRGHGAHVFDAENFVKSEAMPRIDDFRLEADGVVRTTNEDLLPYGDVFAILRAVHDTTATVEREVRTIADGATSEGAPSWVGSKSEEREHVAYFFRRSGERPWLLREQHASYIGLGQERGPVAFANFTRVLARIREAATMAVFDDRLVRRRVPERLDTEGVTSSRHGMDLLAHLLAMTIASQGGSPYR
jgi:hypothetical protein